jgi:integrase
MRRRPGHRLFPALWFDLDDRVATQRAAGSAMEGCVDLKAATLSINRGLVSVGYETHVSRGKTNNSRRAIDLDVTTVRVLSAWRDWQRTEQAVVGVEPTGWVFTNASGNPIHPHSISQTFERIVKRVEVPRIRLHDLRVRHEALCDRVG